MPEHVEALGAVVHAVGGDVGPAAGPGEREFFSLARARNDFVQWMRSRESGELAGGFIEELEKLGW